MSIMKSIFIGITVSALITLGACNSGSQKKVQNDHDHHDEMESEKGHDHSTMEEQHNEMENEAGMHRQHNSIRDNFAHQDIIILDNPYQSSAKVSQDLKEVIVAYLAIKDAFAQDNAAEVDEAAARMSEKVAAVDGSSLKEEGKEAWEQHASLYTSKLAELRHVAGMEEKRSYFSHISEIVYCTVKSFGIRNETGLYVAFCPTAFDGKGAYWITESKEIRNPYFGDKMPTCGKIEEDF